MGFSAILIVLKFWTNTQPKTYPRTNRQTDICVNYGRQSNITTYRIISPKLRDEAKEIYKEICEALSGPEQFADLHTR